MSQKLMQRASGSGAHSCQIVRCRLRGWERSEDKGSICFNNEVTGGCGWSCVGENWARRETGVEMRTGGMDVKTEADRGCSEHTSPRVASRGGVGAIKSTLGLLFQTRERWPLLILEKHLLLHCLR